MDIQKYIDETYRKDFLKLYRLFKLGETHGHELMGWNTDTTLKNYLLGIQKDLLEKDLIPMWNMNSDLWDYSGEGYRLWSNSPFGSISLSTEVIDWVKKTLKTVVGTNNNSEEIEKYLANKYPEEVPNPFYPYGALQFGETIDELVEKFGVKVVDAKIIVDNFWGRVRNQQPITEQSHRKFKVFHIYEPFYPNDRIIRRIFNYLDSEYYVTDNVLPKIHSIKDDQRVSYVSIIEEITTLFGLELPEKINMPNGESVEPARNPIPLVIFKNWRDLKLDELSNGELEEDLDYWSYRDDALGTLNEQDEEEKLTKPFDRLERRILNYISQIFSEDELRYIISQNRDDRDDKWRDTMTLFGIDTVDMEDHAKSTKYAKWALDNWTEEGDYSKIEHPIKVQPKWYEVNYEESGAQVEYRRGVTDIIAFDEDDAEEKGNYEFWEWGGNTEVYDYGDYEYYDGGIDSVRFDRIAENLEDMMVNDLKTPLTEATLKRCRRIEEKQKLISQQLNEQEISLEDELGRQMASFGPIPKSKKQAAKIIKMIFNSSKQPFYDVGDDILLDLDIKKYKDRIRFFEYFKSFKDEKEGRGFNFEGMLAGLMDGEPIVGKDKEDIEVGGKYYSVKTSEPGSSFDSGTLIYGFNNEMKDMEVKGIDTKGITTPYELLKKEGEEYTPFKIGMLSSMFSTGSGGDLEWIFSIIYSDRIEYSVWSSEELISTMITNPNMIGVGRSPKTDVRIKSRFVMTDTKIIRFPEFTSSELRKMRYDKERGLKTDKIAELFGKYKTKVRYDVLEYIRKNPRTFLRRVVDLYGDKISTIMKDKGLIDLNETIEDVKTTLTEQTTQDQIFNILLEETDIFGQGLLDPITTQSYDDDEEWERDVANISDDIKEPSEYEGMETDPDKGFVAPSRDVTDNICNVEGFCDAQGPITFGQLRELVKGATTKRIAGDLGRGGFKTLWRVVPFFLPQLLLVSAGITLTRALNKIVKPALTDTKGYKSWWGKVIMKSMDIAEGDYIPDKALGDDPLSKVFFISDGLLYMLKDKYKLKFARYVAEVADSKPDNEPVPEWFVENLLRDYLNQKFLLDPPLQPKRGLDFKQLKEQTVNREINPKVKEGDWVLVVDGTPGIIHDGTCSIRIFKNYKVMEEEGLVYDMDTPSKRLFIEEECPKEDWATTNIVTLAPWTPIGQPYDYVTTDWLTWLIVGKPEEGVITEQRSEQGLFMKFINEFWPEHRAKLYSDLYNTFHPSTYTESFTTPGQYWGSAIQGTLSDALRDGQRFGLLSSPVDIEKSGYPELSVDFTIEEDAYYNWNSAILLFDVLYDIVNEFKCYCGENGIDDNCEGRCMGDFPPYYNWDMNKEGDLKEIYYTFYNYIMELTQSGIPVGDFIGEEKLKPIKLVGGEIHHTQKETIEEEFDIDKKSGISPDVEEGDIIIIVNNNTGYEIPLYTELEVKVHGMNRNIVGSSKRKYVELKYVEHSTHYESGGVGTVNLPLEHYEQGVDGLVYNRDEISWLKVTTDEVGKLDENYTIDKGAGTNPAVVDGDTIVIIHDTTGSGFPLFQEERVYTHNRWYPGGYLFVQDETKELHTRLTLPITKLRDSYNDPWDYKTQDDGVVWLKVKEDETITESKDIRLNPELMVGDEVTVVSVDKSFGTLNTAEVFVDYVVTAIRHRQPENWEGPDADTRYYAVEPLDGYSDEETLGRMLAGGGRKKEEQLHPTDKWVLRKGFLRGEHLTESTTKINPELRVDDIVRVIDVDGEHGRMPERFETYIVVKVGKTYPLMTKRNRGRHEYYDIRPYPDSSTQFSEFDIKTLYRGDTWIYGDIPRANKVGRKTINEETNNVSDKPFKRFEWTILNLLNDSFSVTELTHLTTNTPSRYDKIGKKYFELIKLFGIEPGTQTEYAKSSIYAKWALDNWTEEGDYSKIEHPIKEKLKVFDIEREESGSQTIYRSGNVEVMAFDEDDAEEKGNYEFWEWGGNMEDVDSGDWYSDDSHVSNVHFNRLVEQKGIDDKKTRFKGFLFNFWDKHGFTLDREDLKLVGVDWLTDKKEVNIGYKRMVIKLGYEYQGGIEVINEKIRKELEGTHNIKSGWVDMTFMVTDVDFYDDETITFTPYLNDLAGLTLEVELTPDSKLTVNIGGEHTFSLSDIMRDNIYDESPLTEWALDDIVVDLQVVIKTYVEDNISAKYGFFVDEVALSVRDEKDKRLNEENGFNVPTELVLEFLESERETFTHNIRQDVEDVLGYCYMIDEYIVPLEHYMTPEEEDDMFIAVCDDATEDVNVGIIELENSLIKYGLIERGESLIGTDRPPLLIKWLDSVYKEIDPNLYADESGWLQYEEYTPQRIMVETETNDETVIFSPKLIKILKFILTVYDVEDYDDFQNEASNFFNLDWLRYLWLILMYNLEKTLGKNGDMVEMLDKLEPHEYEVPEIYEYELVYYGSFGSIEEEEECSSVGYGYESKEECVCIKGEKGVEDEEGYTEYEECEDDELLEIQYNDCDCEEWDTKYYPAYYYDIINQDVMSYVELPRIHDYDYHEISKILNELNLGKDSITVYHQDEPDYDESSSWERFDGNKEGTVMGFDHSKYSKNYILDVLNSINNSVNKKKRLDEQLELDRGRYNKELEMKHRTYGILNQNFQILPHEEGELVYEGKKMGLYWLEEGRFVDLEKIYDPIMDMIEEEIDPSMVDSFVKYITDWINIEITQQYELVN